MNEPLDRCTYCGCRIEPESGVLCDECRHELSKEPVWKLLENGSLKQ